MNRQCKVILERLLSCPKSVAFIIIGTCGKPHDLRADGFLLTTASFARN